MMLEVEEWHDLLAVAADAKSKLDDVGHALSDADGERAAEGLEAVLTELYTIRQVLGASEQCKCR